MRLRSKVDGWLAAVLLASIALPILLLGAGLPLWILAVTHYTFVGEELIVRSGPFRWRIPLRGIKSVTPTRDMLASPALSLDRLRIDHGAGRAVMVSPADKDAFLRAIAPDR